MPGQNGRAELEKLYCKNTLQMVQQANCWPKQWMYEVQEAADLGDNIGKFP